HVFIVFMHCVVFFFFFFFQAEDGIRDLTVTGVQTCALPISRPSCLFSHGRAFRERPPASSLRRLVYPRPSFTSTSLVKNCSTKRSEERRVGKECRSRWSPYD